MQAYLCQRSTLELRLSCGVEGYRLSEPMNTSRELRTSGAPAESEFIFPLRYLLQALWRRLWVLVLIAALFVGIAVGWSLLQVPIYEASAKVLVGQGGSLAENPAYAQNLQEVTLTVAEAIDSRPVAEEVVERIETEMSPEQLLAGLSVEPLPQTQFVTVSFSHPDPEVAREVVIAVGEVFSEQLTDTTDGNITAQLWERAQTPTTAVSPRPEYNGFMALVLGAFVGLAVVLLLEYLDDSWRSSEDAERISGVPNLAIVPKFTFPKSDLKRKQK